MTKETDNNQIILYATNECERCHLVKRMLNAHNVKFVEINDKNIMIEKDLDQVPALEVNGELIDSYQLVLRWLNKNNYYSF